MDYDKLINAYNNKNVQSTPRQLEQSPDFLITQCNNFPGDLDQFFDQTSPYKYPPLLISDDVKRDGQSQDIYKKYMDVIVDECGNRFNTTNLSSSGAGLQIGFARNIDLDSHLKNINYYTDKCYYDNWKIAPNSELADCNGLKRNSQILTPDYTPVGRNYADCLGVCSNVAPCWNTPPTDLNCEVDIRKRYDFNAHNPAKNTKFQGVSCIKPEEWQYFPGAPQPTAKDLAKLPGGSASGVLRDEKFIKLLNNGKDYIHDYYYFANKYPQPQRLFNNVTKRSMLPNHHFRDINPYC